MHSTNHTSGMEESVVERKAFALKLACDIACNGVCAVHARIFLDLKADTFGILHGRDFADYRTGVGLLFF